MHLRTFRKAVAAAGLNPYLIEMANLREHCSWVHPNREAATAKAIDLVRMSVAKVRRNHALNPIQVPVVRRAMVIGGGVAGIQAALDIADAGYEVVLVEREPSIGGKMAGLSETFPTLDCSQCILTPRMVDVGQHERITLHTYSDVESVEGYGGNFRVTVRKRARHVDIEKCTGCG
jgi:heterodisulfide reductase subunit A2